MSSATISQHNRGRRRPGRSLAHRSAWLASATLTAMLLTAEGDALAKYITLNGHTNLAFVPTPDKQIEVTGSYDVDNSGDEAAKQVFVALNLGTWAFVSDPTEIGPGERRSFSIHDQFPVSKLDCLGVAADLCAGEHLPSVGVFPLRVTRYYQEAHGHKFSAVSVENIEIGPISAAQKVAIRVPPVQGSLEAHQAGRDRYVASVHVRNLSNLPQTVSVALLTPRELTTERKPFRITVPASSTASESVAMTNQGGLEGSTYVIPVLLQGAAEDARYLSTATGVVAVTRPNETTSFFFLMVTALLGSLTASLAIFLIVRQRRNRRRAVVQQS